MQRILTKQLNELTDLPFNHEITIMKDYKKVKFCIRDTQVNFYFESDFPFSKPVIKFKSDIYHFLVENKYVNMCDYSTLLTVRQLLLNIFLIILESQEKGKEKMHCT